MPPPADSATLRSLLWRVYVPSLLFFLGDGALLPVIALAARDLGASVAFAGFVVALRSIGVLFFDVPAGWIIARYSERAAVGFASVCFGVTLIGWTLTDSLAVFAVLAFVQGSGWSVWQLARLSYVSNTVGPELRGRAMSVLGGVARAGWFAGPFVGALAYAVAGFEGLYLVSLALAMAAAALLFRFADPDEEREHDSAAAITMLSIVRVHRRALFTVGPAALAIQALRTARIAIVPLWADHIGLSTGTASVIFGISVGVEILLVYPGGTIMDRYGRKAVAVPSIALTSIGLALLPLTHELWSLLLVAVMLGFSNGISSGVVMTLGADLAPRPGTAQFLGVWRVLGDAGTAIGPLAVAGVTAAATLGGAAVACGAVGLLAAAFVHRVVPETRHLPGRGNARPARDDAEAPL